MTNWETRIESRTLTILADEKFENKDFDEALKLYTKARNFQKLRSRGRNLANKGFLAYAATYLSAAGCNFDDENIAQLVVKQFEQGKYFAFAEISIKMNEMKKLIDYANLFISKNKFLMAMIYFDYAKEPFPEEILDQQRRETFKKEIIEHMEHDNYPEYALKGYKILEDYPALLELSIHCLRKKWISSAIEIYKEAAKGDLSESELLKFKEIAAMYANRALVEGEFREGMELYKIIGIKPHPSELITCGNMNLLNEPIFCGKIAYFAIKAFRMAGAMPSKARLENAGDYFRENHMLLQAVDFYDTAESTDKLWSIIKEYGHKEYFRSVYENIIKKAAKSIAKIEEKRSKRKNK